MAKNLQLLRNGVPFKDYATTKAALLSITNINGVSSDGTPIIARYKDGDTVKTLLGIACAYPATATTTSDVKTNGDCTISIIGDISNSVTSITINGGSEYVSSTTGNSGSSLNLTINGNTLTALSGASFVYTYSKFGSVANSAVTTADTIASAIDKIEATIDSVADNAGHSMTYDSAAKKIYLKDFSGNSLSEIDATDFIKDGMIDSVSYNATTHILTITWNTAAGKDATEIDLTGLVDTYDTDNLMVGTGFTTTEYQEELTGATAIAVGDSTSEALNKVETTISALTEEVLNNEVVTEKAINALGNAAGTVNSEGQIEYVVPTTANYISASTSLSNADYILDSKIREIEDEIGSLGIEVTSPNKTITVTDGTKIDVNIDNVTITKDSNGVLSSITDYGVWNITA